MKRDLERHLQDYYQDQALPEQRVGRIRDSARPTRRLVGYAAAAGFVVALVAGMAAYPLMPSGHDTTALTERFGEEVARNHIKYQEPDYRVNTVAELIEALNNQEFQVRPPEKKELTDGLRLLGGRFCSLAGQLAVQIYLKDEASGERASLYVTAADGELRNLGAEELRHDQTRIEVWEEEGLIYALAE